MLSSPQTLMVAVDTMVIVLTVVAFVILLLKGEFNSSLGSTSGRLLAISGVAIMLVVEVIALVWPAFWSVAQPLAGGSPAGAGVLGRILWLLSRLAFVLMVAGILRAVLQRRRLELEILSSSQQVKAVEDGIVQTEERFRRMVETTTESVYCFEFNPPMSVALPVPEQVGRSHDAVLVECNRAFAKELGAEQPSDVIGRRMGSLDGNRDTQSHYHFFKSLIESGYQLADYELVYKTPQGEDRAFLTSLTGFGHSGYLHKMWGAERSIQDLRKTKFALEVRQRFLELFADISSRLVMTTNEKADVEIRSCLKDICLFLGSDRVTLFWFNKQTQEADALHYWNKEGVSAQLAPAMKKIPRLDSISDIAMRAEVIRIDDVSQMSGHSKADQKVLAGFGLKSALVVPMIVAGENVGAVSIANLQNRRVWSDQDVIDLRVVAELFASFILRQKSYHALDDALSGLQRATDRLEAENVYLRQEIKSTHGFDEIIGQSTALVQCLHSVEQVAQTMTPVLVLGETGTGKELIARAIHEHSDRDNRPLVKVNCAALPGNLIESELFGYEKGAFTGADSSKRGRFDLADKGTLFLDEIGDIPIDLQSKLLRVLQEGEFERLGGTETLKVDVRLIVATNRNLSDAVDKGEFRSDLYYRINTFPIALPALRERGSDIQFLAEHFVKVHSQRLEREVTAISANMMEQLNQYSWPGNVRELEGVVQRALISGSGSVIELAAPLIKISAIEADEPRVLSTSISDLHLVEKEHIVAVLEESSWKISGTAGAAAKLGIPPSTLRSKMKKLSIIRPH